MSLSVGKINNISFKSSEIEVNKKPEVKSESSTDSEGMSTTTKAMIGLGALATAVAGGLLVKKRLNAKATDKFVEEAKKLLQKPADFTDESLKDLFKTLREKGTYIPEHGDIACVVNKDFLLNGVTAEYAKLHEAMNLSDNAFAILIKKGNENTLLKYYFDPENISSKYVKTAFEKGDNFVELRFPEFLLNKVKEFNSNNVIKYIEDLKSLDKVVSGDSVCIIPKKDLYNETSSSSGAKEFLDLMDMSDNGFLIAIRKDTGDLDASTIRYIDPEQITSEAISKSIKKGESFEFKIEDLLSKLGK